jgi:hypothetical protein
MTLTLATGLEMGSALLGAFGTGFLYKGTFGLVPAPGGISTIMARYSELWLRGMRG